MPGPIWQSVSFPPDRDITDTEFYLFVAVLFFVDKNLRDGEPRVWNELNAAWDAKFGLATGGRPTWDDQRYGSLVLGGFIGDGGVNATVQSMVDPTQTVSMHIRPGLSLDLAISGECDLLGYWEEQWLKDCLSRYSSEEPIDSLEKLHDVRARMNSEVEGARGGGGHVRGGGGSPTMEALFGCHRSSGDSMMIKLHENRAGPASSRARCLELSDEILRRC